MGKRSVIITFGWSWAMQKELRLAFRRGMDTFDLAKELHFTEAEIYNALHRARQNEYLLNGGRLP